MSMQSTKVQLDEHVRTWNQIIEHYSNTTYVPALRLKLAQIRMSRHGYEASASSAAHLVVAKVDSVGLAAQIFLTRRLGYQSALPEIFTS